MNENPKPSKNLAVHRTLDRVRCYGATHRGKIRDSNQDHFLIATLRKRMDVGHSSIAFDAAVHGEPMGHLLLVADGVGGNLAGEVASELAIESVTQFLLNSMHWLIYPNQPEIDQFMRDLKSAANVSHETVLQDAKRHPEHMGMGTTLTVCYIVWPMVYILHVGDSRCYVWHQNGLLQITKDQTLAQLLYDHGNLDEAAFRSSPYQHVLMSSIGGEENPEAVVYQQRLCEGDRVLLCTDGVTRHCQEKEIGKLLQSSDDPQSACEQLIDVALQRGGHDNITAVLAFC